MVYRVYVEKKEGFLHEANGLYSDIITFLGIKGLTKVRVINRYDVENIEKEIEAVRNRNARTITVEGEAENGDIAVIDYIMMN